MDSDTLLGILRDYKVSYFNPITTSREEYAASRNRVILEREKSLEPINPQIALATYE